MQSQTQAPNDASMGDRTVSFEGIGTQWVIDSATPIGPAVRAEILDCVEIFDRRWSRFRPDSLVTRIARGEIDQMVLPDEDIALFELYDRLFDLTHGAVDPLVGAQLEHWGYDASYSLRPKPGRPPRDQSWETALVRQGGQLQINAPVTIDFGAAGKGFLVDRIAAILAAAGHADVLVDGSGDMRRSGSGTTRVGLEHPFAERSVIGVAELGMGALCASATNRRVWGDGLHHVLDARSGDPVRKVVATWVTAASATVADGVATALFFVPAAQLRPHFDFEAVRMFADGTAERTSNFPGTLFT